MLLKHITKDISGPDVFDFIPYRSKYLFNRLVRNKTLSVPPYITNNFLITGLIKKSKIPRKREKGQIRASGKKIAGLRIN